MPKTRAPYASEFRQRMVELVRGGRTPEELSREFEPVGPVDPQLGSPEWRDRGERPAGGSDEC